MALHVKCVSESPPGTTPRMPVSKKFPGRGQMGSSKGRGRLVLSAARHRDMLGALAGARWPRWPHTLGARHTLAASLSQPGRILRSPSPPVLGRAENLGSPWLLFTARNVGKSQQPGASPLVAPLITLEMGQEGQPFWRKEISKTLPPCQSFCSRTWC